MNTKTKIIIISVMLLTFFIAITIILLVKNNNKVEDNESTPHYATNATEETTETPNGAYVNEEGNIVMENGVERVNEYSINDVTYTNLNELTDEQYQNKSQMTIIVKNFINNYYEDTGKLVTSAEVMDITNKDDTNVYLKLNFNDDTDEEVVVLYDSMTNHRYLRCVTVEYWNSILAGENAG